MAPVLLGVVTCIDSARKQEDSGIGQTKKKNRVPQPGHERDMRQTHTASPLCWPTRYDLHLRDGTERKRVKRKRAGQEGRSDVRQERAPVCLLPCFSLSVDFWQAVPAAGIRQSALRWPGEEGRQDWERGAGARGGTRGGGSQLTEGYKYPLEPDDRTVSHLETDGRALAGHLATLALWRRTQTQTAPPTAQSLMMLVAASFCDIKPHNLITICQN